jgi:hypothetical protein
MSKFTEGPRETRPGVYTTEFWTMLLTQVLGALQLTGVFDVAVGNKYVVLAMAIVAGLYNASRGFAKQGVKP